MGNKVNHYYNGIQWTQMPNGGIADSELTITDIAGGAGNSAGAANRFISLKASDDTMYVLAGTTNTSYNWRGKLFIIDKLGNKSMVYLDWNQSGVIQDRAIQPQLQEMGNGDILIKGNCYSTILVPVYVFTKAKIMERADEVEKILATTDAIKTFPTSAQCCVYKNLYLWRLYGSTVYIYDYSDASLRTSIGVNTPDGMTLIPLNPVANSVAGTLFLCGYFSGIIVYVNNVLNTYFITTGVSNDRFFVDKWNNVCSIYEAGYGAVTDRIIYKWKLNTNGQGITSIGNITLTGKGGVWTFDTDINGNYYYSNATGTWKIPANTEADQNFYTVDDINKPHVKIRNAGWLTYNNSIAGWNPSAKAT